MTLIIKELVIKSTIVNQKETVTTVNDQQLKEEVIKACMSKLKRHFKNKKER